MNSKSSNLNVRPELPTELAWIALAKAFWSDEDELIQHLAEVQAFVDFIEFSRERKMESSSVNTLRNRERVRVQKLLELGLSSNTCEQTGFYRLGAEERWVLMALYRCRCSYAQIAETLNVSEREVSEIAWSGRLELASTQSVAGWSVPTGSRQASPQCPDYDVRDPWTQRYLDGEFHGEGAVFLQTHLVGCGSCRDALQSARMLYAKVKTWVPEFSPAEIGRVERALQTVQGRSKRAIAHAAFGKSFWTRKDVWAAAAILAGLVCVLVGKALNL